MQRRVDINLADVMDCFKTRRSKEHGPEHAVAIANAVLAAKCHDPLSSALGLAYFASVLLDGADETERTTLALTFMSIAHELNSDLFLAARWH
jgi:hypothetical protein